LDEIGDQQRPEQLGEKRQPADPLLQRRPDQPAEQAVDGEIDDHQCQSDQKVVHHEVREVDLPVRPEDRLSAMQWKQLLDQDEHQAGAQQVEDEPIEADIGGVVWKVADRNAMATRGKSQSNQDQGGAVQPAIAQSNQVGEGKAAGDHHPDEQDLAKHVHVVLPAEVRCGQVFGKVEGEHRQDGKAAQRQGDDTGDLASTDVKGTGLEKDGGRLLQDRRWLHGTRAGRQSPAPIRLIPWRIAAMLRPQLIVSSVLPVADDGPYPASLIRLPVALGPVDRAALALDVGKLMAENQQAAVVSVPGHVSGSTHELERTLSEARRPRASWTARHERAHRALDDRSGPADRGKRARSRLRSPADDRP
jgi:hypothetical protein